MTNSRSRMLISRPRRAAVAALLALTTLNCGEVDDALEPTTGALSIMSGVTGMNCGMAYHCNGCGTAPTVVIPGSCSDSRLGPQGFLPAVFSEPNGGALFGYHLAVDGDRGRAPGFGFFHQTLNPTPGSGDVAHSHEYMLPKGTACGFKESCNDSGERCMGFDANVACPNGWLRKVGTDVNAPSGCGFVWCEYQDPLNLCTGRCFANQTTSSWLPMGLTCGITDTDRQNGQCLGQPTHLGCPAGWNNGGLSPPQNGIDHGRPLGHGILWCSKASINL